MALSITTLSITALSKTTLSITALSITTLNITALSITTLNITALSITTLNITALSITALLTLGGVMLSEESHFIYYYAECLYAEWGYVLAPKNVLEELYFHDDLKSTKTA